MPQKPAASSSCYPTVSNQICRSYAWLCSFLYKLVRKQIQDDAFLYFVVVGKYDFNIGSIITYQFSANSTRRYDSNFFILFIWIRMSNSNNSVKLVFTFRNGFTNDNCLCTNSYPSNVRFKMTAVKILSDFVSKAAPMWCLPYL